tara:strand:- start:706 stop:1449 length:744 start_codon:yes stop_codon:yes gene_type:complete
MSFIVPGLTSYFGGKGGDGTYQKIINLIPPHKTFIVPFTGHCGITRNILPSEHIFLNDYDYKVFEAWLDYTISDSTNVSFKNRLSLSNQHFEVFFKFLEYESFYDHYDTVIYCDPPYRHSDRKSDHTYNVEMTEEEHITLLGTIKAFQNSNVLISTYDNELYKEMLNGWNKISFTSQTRRGKATETVYYNYEPPEKLHDYSYIGNNYKKREQYKLKRFRLIDKFERMTPLERNYFLDAIKTRYKTTF